MPRKITRISVRSRYLNCLIFTDKTGQTIICKRNNNDIWKGLYQFPIIETTEKDNSEWHSTLPSGSTILKVSGEIVHQLTHQKLHARFWHISVTILPLGQYEDSAVVFDHQLDQYAFPRLISRYLGMDN